MIAGENNFSKIVSKMAKKIDSDVNPETVIAEEDNWDGNKIQTISNDKPKKGYNNATQSHLQRCEQSSY